ncbi:hypothetical protein CUB91_022740 [Serratia marcescens]|nr:hypothetical protein [Serratia marcescens]
MSELFSLETQPIIFAFPGVTQIQSHIGTTLQAVNTYINISAAKYAEINDVPFDVNDHHSAETYVIERDHSRASLETPRLGDGANRLKLFSLPPEVLNVYF